MSERTIPIDRKALEEALLDIKPREAPEPIIATIIDQPTGLKAGELYTPVETALAIGQAAARLASRLAGDTIEDRFDVKMVTLRAPEPGQPHITLRLVCTERDRPVANPHMEPPEPAGDEDPRQPGPEFSAPTEKPSPKEKRTRKSR